MKNYLKDKFMALKVDDKFIVIDCILGVIGFIMMTIYIMDTNKDFNAICGMIGWLTLITSSYGNIRNALKHFSSKTEK